MLSETLLVSDLSNGLQELVYELSGAMLCENWYVSILMQCL